MCGGKGNLLRVGEATLGFGEDSIARGPVRKGGASS